MDKKLILVVNDDGINSPGIFELASEMKKLGEVIVAAPSAQQSAVSRSLTLSRPLRVEKYWKNGDFFGFAVDGTPADTAKLALTTLLDRKPDLLVSGINHGKNTSINIVYSGTVAGAAEGTLLGVPSMAVSVDSHSLGVDCRPAAVYAGKIAKNILENGLPKNCLLNVNVPVLELDEIKGVRITYPGKSIWKDAYERRKDPFNREYFWFSGEFFIEDESEDSDDKALKEGFVSASPLQFNFSNTELFSKLKKLEQEIN